MPKPLIVFDMDGVLVDVSRSYRDVVRQTARVFFRGAEGWERLPRPLCNLSDIAAVKHSGGLNNDWDLTCKVISLLMPLVDTDGRDIVSDGDPWSTYENQIREWDVSGLAHFLVSSDMPLSQLMEEDEEEVDPRVAGFYRGDIGSGNIIKQIFQEIYLGEALFTATYHVRTNGYGSDGLILRETLLMDRSTLEAFSSRGILALATGRPRKEADFSLDRFQIREYFSVVYTLDECLAEEQKRQDRGNPGRSLSKPDPFMLDAIAEQLSGRFGRCFYVGDMPDDMIAASRSKAPFQGVGVLMSSPEKDRLKAHMKQADAKYIIESFEELQYLLDPD